MPLCTTVRYKGNKLFQIPEAGERALAALHYS